MHDEHSGIFENGTQRKKKYLDKIVLVSECPNLMALNGVIKQSDRKSHAWAPLGSPSWGEQWVSTSAAYIRVHNDAVPDCK